MSTAIECILNTLIFYIDEICFKFKSVTDVFYFVFYVFYNFRFFKGLIV